MAGHSKFLTAGVFLITLVFHGYTPAASIETLVMPGQVSEAHAGVETECSACHKPFSRILQQDLCLSCHDHSGVKEDMESGSGFHGRSETVGRVECATCHTEHEGRAADIVKLDSETFDHRLTDFLLEGVHVDRICEDCHVANESFRKTSSTCFACHEAVDSHGGQLGQDCGQCHDTSGWQTIGFDHAKDTEFILTGVHKATECVLCHSNQQYKGIPRDCYSCHQINDQHRGNYGRKCARCHQTDDWERIIFDHDQSGEFPLLGRHVEIACKRCHWQSQLDAPLARECVSCHRVDDLHQGSNGAQCDACHDNTQWQNTSFDHLKDTKFQLRGAHADLACQVCHSSRATDMSLDTTCFSCHQVDDVHQQGLGQDCARCHKQTAWSMDVLFDHDLSAFPLIGLHAVTFCEACHPNSQFADTPGQCVDCHDQDDSHNKAFGDRCESCHNPNDWLLWEFDHEDHTGYVLEGEHAELACQDCHAGHQKLQNRKLVTCATCHRSDDVHSGGFGRQCSRCHNNRSFKLSGVIQ